MNDFTKEELEELLMWSNHLAGYNPSLLKKIQSMIDNYSTNDCQPIVNVECQHEDDGLCYYSLPPQCKCKKCGEFYR